MPDSDHETTDQEARLLRDGLYRDGALIAGRSVFSGRVSFPAPAGEGVETLVLGSACTLFSFTTVHMKTAHFDPPYCIGYVDFPEGVRVFGPIRTADPASLQIGMEMRVDVGPLWAEPDGTMVAAHSFTPAERT